MKVLISPLKAQSMVNQALLVKRLLNENTIDAEIKSYIGINDVVNPENTHFIWMTLAAVDFLIDITPSYFLTRKSRVVYVTIEGYPIPVTFKDTNIPKIEFIANSEFTKKCLERAKLKVKDVVHHAVDASIVEKNKDYFERVRQAIKSAYKNRVLFLYVGRHDPRKGLEYLAQAVKILNETHKDKYVLLLHTNESARELFQESNTLIIGKFGSRTYEQVMSLYYAADYIVFPSVCEGFGLPVLEANAVGRPVIHCWFEPLSEFSSKEFNFVFNYAEVQYVKNMWRQYWIFHVYDPTWLADMMKYAIDVYLNSKEEYQEYCEKAKEHAANWDYHKVYPKLLKHLGIHVVSTNV